MKKLLLFTLSTIMILSFGCKKEKNKSNSLNPKKIEQIADTGFNEQAFFQSIDQSKIAEVDEIIGGFASPVEASAMLKDYHIPFNKNYLAPTSYANNYDINLKKALGLGIYSADLGYLNIYHKNTQIINYLQVIFQLASQLRVAQFFDFQSLKYLVTTSDNVDSLLFLSVNSFYQIDAYFRSTRRSYLSLLSVTGVWIESLYLLTQVQKDNPYVSLRSQIGSQKDLLNKLLELLEVYQGHPEFNYLIKQFKKLQQAFAPVQIKEQKYNGKTRTVKDGRVIYSQDVETVINMDDQTLDNIIKATAQVRKAVLNMP